MSVSLDGLSRRSNHMGEKFESGELVAIKVAIQKLIAVLSDSD
jgi:hypothetical protein